MRIASPVRHWWITHTHGADHYQLLSVMSKKMATMLWKTCLTSTRDWFSFSTSQTSMSVTWNETDTIFGTPTGVSMDDWTDFKHARTQPHPPNNNKDLVRLRQHTGGETEELLAETKPLRACLLCAFGPPYTHTNQIGSTKYAYPERHSLYNNVIIWVVLAGWCSTSSIDLVCHQNTTVSNGGSSLY